MNKWKYTIDISQTWKEYRSLSALELKDKELFNKMKEDITAELEKKIMPSDAAIFLPVVKKLKQSKSLAGWNKGWDMLYDVCDYNRIWLATF